MSKIATILKVFNLVSDNPLAAIKVESEGISLNTNYNLVRGGKIIFSGMLKTIRLLKEETTSVDVGKECGIIFDGFTDFLEGDQLEKVK